MRLNFVKLAAAVAIVSFASSVSALADAYTLASFSGGIFGGNANAQAPFGSAGITQGMSLSGTFLIDTSSDNSGAFNNIFYSSYADAALIGGATDFSFGLGSLLFTGAGDPTGGAIQYHNGHFNGFAYSSDFDYQDVGYNFTISGGTFSIIERDNFAQKVSGYINIGDNNVTGKTPFTPTSVDTPPTTDVPEPLTLSLFSAGIAGIAVAMRRRRKKSQAV